MQIHVAACYRDRGAHWVDRTRSGTGRTLSIFPWAMIISILILQVLTTGCGEPERQITAEDLRGMIPPLEEASAVLGLPMDELEIRADLGQEFEGIETEQYGLTASYIAIYRQGEAESALGILLTLALFGTEEGARDCRNEILRRLDEDAERLARFQGVQRHFDPGVVGDEARGLIVHSSPGEPWVTGVAVRSNKVVALIWVLHSDERDMTQQAIGLANSVSQRIEAFDQG
jgi:hypothetical protein